MKKNRLLIVFIAFAIAGAVLINFIYPSYFKNRNIELLETLDIPEGFRASVVVKGLDNPSSFFINKDGSIYISENTKSGGRIVKYTPKGEYSVVAKGFDNSINHIMMNKDTIYISQKGKLSRLEGQEIKDIISGLPSYGDYSNNGIYFGPDGMIYICQGAATNSGVVGMDNYERGWLKDNPFFHDYLPWNTVLNGMNFKTENPLTKDKNDRASTGGFQSFNTEGSANQEIKGRLPGNASILRVTPNGDVMDLFAWGVRNPVGIIVMPDGRVFVSVQGMENRGSRPVANGKDYIYDIKKGTWLGWPDYEGGEPVNQQKFKVKNHQQPQFLTALHPSTTPQKPLAAFEESGRIGMIDYFRGNESGLRGNIVVPIKKGAKQEAKIALVDSKSGSVTDFIRNKENNAFLEQPVQCVVGGDGKLYVLEAKNGLIFRIEKENEVLEGILPMYIPIEYFIGFVIISFSVYLVFALRKNKEKKQA